MGTNEQSCVVYERYSFIGRDAKKNNTQGWKLGLTDIVSKEHTKLSMLFVVVKLLKLFWFLFLYLGLSLVNKSLNETSWGYCCQTLGAHLYMMSMGVQNVKQFEL